MSKKNNPDYQKKYHEARIAKGLCSSCGKNPSRPGLLSCSECAKYFRDQNKKQRKERSEHGLCMTCGKRPPRTGRATCLNCITKARAFQKKNTEQNKKKNICIHCGKRPSRPGKFTCSECASANMRRYRKRMANRKRQNLCRTCGKNPTPPGFATCQECRSKRRKKEMDGNRDKALKRDEYQCHICGESEKRLCVHHIDGRGRKHPNPNHDLDNLTTLCTACHASITRFRFKDFDQELITRLILA